MSAPWVVHKFGGTSLANADRYPQVADILRAEPAGRKAIVVSAMAKVTDGLARRLFGALGEVGVSVVMISQASSEHSICFAIPEGQASLARKTVERAFFAELHHSQIQTVEVMGNCSILAAVGDRMVDHPGVAGKFFSALGKSRVNIRAIAQGSSERNISVVIDRDDAQRALRAVHAAFYLSAQTISIGVIGRGLIGGTFLDQLQMRMEALKRQRQIDLRVRGIIDSKTMWLSEHGRTLENWRESMQESGVPAKLEEFVRHVQADHFPHAVLIEVTAGGVFADLLRLASYLGGSLA